MPPWLIPSRVTSSASGAPWGAAEGRGTNQKDALLLASHLIIHLPPRVGAYVLASHPDLAKITADYNRFGDQLPLPIPSTTKRTIPLAATPCAATSGH